MSKKEQKNVDVVENIKDENVSKELVENWIENANEPTTTPDETQNDENWTNQDETKPENDEQKDEEENATDKNVENWTNPDETQNDDENVMKTTDVSDSTKNHDNVENVVEDQKWLIHVKAIFNRWSIDKGCEYWIEQKFFEEKKYLFEVLD